MSSTKVTVAELISWLENCPQDAYVVIPDPAFIPSEAYEGLYNGPREMRMADLEDVRTGMNPAWWNEDNDECLNFRCVILGADERFEREARRDVKDASATSDHWKAVANVAMRILDRAGVDYNRTLLLQDPDYLLRLFKSYDLPDEPPSLSEQIEQAELDRQGRGED